MWQGGRAEESMQRDVARASLPAMNTEAEMKASRASRHGEPRSQARVQATNLVVEVILVHERNGVAVVVENRGDPSRTCVVQAVRAPGDNLPCPPTAPAEGVHREYTLDVVNDVVMLRDVGFLDRVKQWQRPTRGHEGPWGGQRQHTSCSIKHAAHKREFTACCILFATLHNSTRTHTCLYMSVPTPR